MKRSASMENHHAGGGFRVSCRMTRWAHQRRNSPCFDPHKILNIKTRAAATTMIAPVLSLGTKALAIPPAVAETAPNMADSQMFGAMESLQNRAAVGGMIKSATINSKPTACMPATQTATPFPKAIPSIAVAHTRANLVRRSLMNDRTIGVRRRRVAAFFFVC